MFVQRSPINGQESKRTRGTAMMDQLKFRMRFGFHSGQSQILARFGHREKKGDKLLWLILAGSGSLQWDNLTGVSTVKGRFWTSPERCEPILGWGSICPP